MTAIPYNKNLLRPPYDAIMIGSGIGGMTAAALLAKAGKKVLVLEQHYVAGGFTHVFERKGYEWDVGIHYIGDVHRKNSMLRRLFDHLTEEQLDWSPMPAVYDKGIFPDAEYEFVAGVQNFKERFYSYFPKEKQAIDEYVRLVFHINRSAQGFFAGKAMPPWLGALASPVMGRAFSKLAARTTWDVLRSLTTDEKLIGALCTQYGDYGLPPKQSSFAIHAMVVKHYFDGGAYPVGGSSRIADTILPVIEKSGGQIFVKARVEKIMIRHNRACGVQLATGDEIECPLILSDAGVFNTLGHLVDEETQGRHRIRHKIKNVHPSVSHVCLYGGIRQSPGELNIPSTNLWIYPSYDHDKNVERYIKNPDADFPVVYVSFPASKDPTWDQRHPNRSTVELISLAPYEWFMKWENTKWMKRGDEYKSLKEKMAERLLKVLYGHVPSLEGKIDYHELSTPLSTRHFGAYQKGEIYGLDHTPERFRQKWLRPQTPIKGLYLTGQDIVTDGIAGALMGGVLTASALLKRNLVKDIL